MYVHNKDLQTLLVKIYTTNCNYAKDDFCTAIYDIAVDQATRKNWFPDRETIDDYVQYSMIKIVKILDDQAIDPTKNVYGFLTRYFSNKAIDYIRKESKYQSKFSLMTDAEWLLVSDGNTGESEDC